jgi:LacI family transcriptional regulator of maltose regulon
LNSGSRWRPAELPEEALDDLPLTWVTTPARELGQSLAECILRRMEEGQGAAKTDYFSRLITRK